MKGMQRWSSFVLSASALASIQLAYSFVPYSIHRAPRCTNVPILLAVQEHPTEDEQEDVQKVLKSVTKQQLVDLCERYQVPTIGGATKAVLIQRLRQYADDRARQARQHLEARKFKIQEGCGENDKERYEVIRDEESNSNNWDEDDDDGAFFFFEDPYLTINMTTTTATKTKQQAQPITSAELTSPPPPAEPDENGERVVKTYSTLGQNDLTGVAAAQPQNAAAGGGISDLGSTMMGASSSSSSGTNIKPWETSPNTKKINKAEQERAKEQVYELVSALLANTGAPGFVDDNEHQDAATAFTGFDPSSVPADLLTSCSQSIRTGRGQVLRDVLHECELRAVGYDGAAGDDVSRGGGHYAQVSKVRAFLEGYRQAQVRAQARETLTLLLDKLMQEGVNGLDFTLQTMVRSSDDTGVGGELNDSLIEFLNDVIRQQEQRVDELVSARLTGAAENNNNFDDDETKQPTQESDPMDQLWNVTTGEDGQRIETLDPKHPSVKKVLEEELSKESESMTRANALPDTAPEKLLLLLTLLRERIKVEATFPADEKSRNLRLLAYCLRLPSHQDRQQLITDHLGKSLDGLDSFVELVKSSIEYGESTSYELQPAKKRVLNVPELKAVLSIATEVHKKTAVKASGLLA